MSLHYGIRVLQKFKAFGPIYDDWHFSSWKNSARNVYSLLPCNDYRYPSQPLCGEMRKTDKQMDKKNVGPKIYMRDVVREISNILRYTSWDSAQEQLHRLHIKWDSFTVNQVLKTHPPMEKAWLFFNWTSKQKGFKHDQFTYTTMLDIFGEARRINSMKYVFQLMQEKGIKIDAITYTSMLHWLSNSGDFDGAVKMWKEMKDKHCRPTVVSYTAYMKVLFDNNRAEEASEVYKEILQSGLKPTCHTYTILMEHLMRSGKCKSALEVFTKMQETGVQPDKATCNILVEQCSKAGEAWAIIQILNYMKENSLVLRYPIYLQANETLKMAGGNGMLLQEVNPHISTDAFDSSAPMELKETESDMKSSTDWGLLMELIRKKNFAAIDRLFSGTVTNNMWLDPEIVSKIIEVNCAHGRTDAALSALEYSNNRGIHIKQVTYLSIIGVLMRKTEFSKILQIVEPMAKIESFLEPQLAASLIYRFGYAGDLNAAIKIFNLLPETTSTMMYTALIHACFSAGDPDKGIETFKTMKRRGIQGACGTYNVLIRGLKICGRVDEAKFYWKEKRSLHREEHVSETVLMDRKICDTLFAGYMVS